MVYPRVSLITWLQQLRSLILCRPCEHKVPVKRFVLLCGEKEQLRERKERGREGGRREEEKGKREGGKKERDK